jgi:hypothetical protein
MNLIKSDENWWANLPKLSLGYDILEMTKELGYYNEILTQAPRKNPVALAGKLRWILKNLDDDTISQLNLLYARDYNLLKDLNIVLFAFRELGK